MPTYSPASEAHTRTHFPPHASTSRQGTHQAPPSAPTKHNDQPHESRKTHHNCQSAASNPPFHKRKPGAPQNLTPSPPRTTKGWAYSGPKHLHQQAKQSAGRQAGKPLRAPNPLLVSLTHRSRAPAYTWLNPPIPPPHTQAETLRPPAPPTPH